MLCASLPDASWVQAVGDIPGVEFVIDPLNAPAAHQDRVEVVVPPYMTAYDLGLFARMPRLRLVQTLTAGYDGIIERLPAGVALANAAGVHDASTAELAVALTLASLRQIPEFVRAGDRGEWLRPGFVTALADRRVLIVGYGSIGRTLASRLKPFEVDLVAVASRRRDGDDYVSRVHGVDELPDLLPTADVVIVVVPLSEATTGLVGEDFLAKLPDGALVVNVARGKVADTEALLRHAGRLRIALDVTDPEPLPADHPLWQAPGVLISPHTGGASTAFFPRAVAMLRSQLSRVASGEPPAHVVH